MRISLPCLVFGRKKMKKVVGQSESCQSQNVGSGYFSKNTEMARRWHGDWQRAKLGLRECVSQLYVAIRYRPRQTA